MSSVNSILIPTCGPVHGTIRPPGSKSLSNRALVCAALAEGTSLLRGVLESEDTHVMIDSLKRLGIEVQAGDAAHSLRVVGCAGKIPVSQADLFCANSGTTIRFLSALVALGAGDFRLDGVARMRQRPIGDLLTALQQLGIDARSELGTDCPPVIVRATGLAGGTVQIRGDVSSQFLSAILMIAPYARQDIELVVAGELVSQPYVRMTLQVMRSFGVQAPLDDLSQIKIPAGQTYQGIDYAIEPDASAASYFWAVAAITGGEVTVSGLSLQALQGDVQFVNCLQQMGCEVTSSADSITVKGGRLQGIDIDMNAISDTAQTLSVVALFAAGSTTIRGIGHNRHKETDRIGDLARELRKLGAEVDEFDDGFRVTPPIAPFQLRPAKIETYNDHRMAMSLALAGLRIPGVEILNPCCTEKTYPRYFEDLVELVGG